MADYSRAAKHFHEMGSRPLFTTYVRDWTGDGSRDQKREPKSYHTPRETTPAHCPKLSGNRRKVRTGDISTHANYASKRDASCLVQPLDAKTNPQRQEQHKKKTRQETTRPRKKSYPKIGPAKSPQKEQIRTGPGGAKSPDSAAVKIWSLFN